MARFSAVFMRYQAFKDLLQEAPLTVRISEINVSSYSNLIKELIIFFCEFFLQEIW